MLDSKAEITRSLSQLIGLSLSIARDTADMKNFQFGAIKPHSSGIGTVGQYALHVQCPWRMVATHGTITGSVDYYEPAQVGTEVNQRDGRAGNLQRIRLGEVLGEYDEGTRSWINNADRLIVQVVLVDDYGGFELHLTGDFRLQILPCGSRGEDWRFFAPATDDNHLVVEAGIIAQIAPAGPTCDESLET